MEKCSSTKISAIIQKLNLDLLETNYNCFVNNEKMLYSKLLNDHLKFKYMFDGDSNSESNFIDLNINFENHDMSRSQKFLFKSPLEIFLITDFMEMSNNANDNSQFQYVSVHYANIGFKFNFSMFDNTKNGEKAIVFKICNKIKYCLIGTFEKHFKVNHFSLTSIVCH
jgi:hypothetical protein